MQGGTDLLPGTMISKSELYDIIQTCLGKDRDVPIVRSVLLGITRASLKSDSFLSAASFGDDARLDGGRNPRQEGHFGRPEENIIIGGLIPAGTGIVDASYHVNESKKE